MAVSEYVEKAMMAGSSSDMKLGDECHIVQRKACGKPYAPPAGFPSAASLCHCVCNRVEPFGYVFLRSVQES